MEGSLEPGADADLTIVDLGEEREVHAADFPSACDDSLYEGWRMKGWLVMTIVRGRPVMERGRVIADAGWGRYLAR